MAVQSQAYETPICTKMVKTLLKMGSYLTVVLPVIALVGKIVSRCKLHAIATKAKNVFNHNKAKLVEDEKTDFEETKDTTTNLKKNSHVTVGTYNVLFGQGGFYSNLYPCLIGYKKIKKGRWLII